jgi:hypothetical protein
MANLLPETAQKKIHAEYRARFLLAGSFLAMSVALFTALALFPSYAVLFVTRPAAAAQASQVQQSKQDAADVAVAQALAFQLAPSASASSSISTALLDALGKRPGGVHIDSIVYVGGTPATIAVGGVADSRDMLDKYRTALQGNSRFTAVNLPVGDLVGVKGGRFTITLSGKF